MNLGKLINLIVVCIVIYILFIIVRFLILPDIQVGPGEGMPPSMITQNIWGSATSVALMIFTGIVVGLLIIWMIYQVIRRIPLIGKIIIKKVPPFSALQASGIFGLFDNVFGIIFSRMPLPTRFVKFVQALVQFGGRSSGFIYGSLSGMMPPDKSNTKAKPKDTSKPEDPNFTQSDQNYMQDQLQMCFEENILEITPEMSPADKKTAKLQNELARTTCRTKQLQIYLDTITSKLPTN